MSDLNLKTKRLELLSETKDPNEFINTFRLLLAEENNMRESDLFPLTDDAAGDLVYGFLGMWLATRARLPIENREQVINALDTMAAFIQKMKEHIPTKPHDLKRGVLHCLRKGVNQNLNSRHR